MFDFGFSEVLLTSVIALIVLGPEKLPRAASQVGRWVGRARAMARQFREQLEEEVNLENVKKAHKEEEAKREADAAKAAAGGGSGEATDQGASNAGGAATAQGQPDTDGAAQKPDPGRSAAAVNPAPAETLNPYEYSAGSQPADATPAPFSSQIAPDPSEFRADTFSHAHPTNEFGANPLTANGAAEAAPPPSAPTAHVAEPAASSGAPAPGLPAQAQHTNSVDVATPSDAPARADASEAYASSTAAPTEAEKPGHA